MVSKYRPGIMGLMAFLVWALEQLMCVQRNGDWVWVGR